MHLRNFNKYANSSASLELVFPSALNIVLASLKTVQKTFCRLFLTRGTEQYPLYRDVKLCKMGCLSGEVCMCPNPHTLAKALGIYYFTAGVLTEL